MHPAVFRFSVIPEFAFPVAAIGPNIAAMSVAFAPYPVAGIDNAILEAGSALAVRQSILDIAFVAAAIGEIEDTSAVGLVMRPVAVIALSAVPGEFSLAFLATRYQRTFELITIAP